MNQKEADNLKEIADRVARMEHYLAQIAALLEEATVRNHQGGYGKAIRVVQGGNFA